ncbi:WXG100 family type VII secretion target [Streptomyces sp. JJ38]|uniref:WXG100 family type VII secretion target n=1 Tax=Streptomyces sp. JJ38 TaxID=2738128 RepID=UPI001C592FE6|nr:WXG100 family type VII secretion target [Streptomyces sp. JJ38]MBW1599617.1 hypothetical protein [Streptomyces sp. JJ38]
MSDEEPSIDEAQAHLQVNLTDISRRQRSMLSWSGGNASLGQTDFEGYQLNSMLDMIESSKPSDLEAAADALSNASDAIEGVGEDIKKYAANVDWEGESGDAFRAWADNLGKNTLKLASYTGQAGIQMRAASIGLASVKSSMPPREYGPYLPVDIQEASAADDPRERNRQEAINQMNRLSSFYKVSHDNMATQEEPTFAPPPDFGVPEPKDGHKYDVGSGGRASPPASTSERPVSDDRPSLGSGTTVSASLRPTEVTNSTRPVGTEINNTTLPTSPMEQSITRPGPTTSSPPSVPSTLPVVPPTTGTQRVSEQRTGRFSEGRNPQKRAFPPLQSDTGSRSDARAKGTPPVAGRPPGPNVGNAAPMGRPPQMNVPPRTGRPDAIFGGLPHRPGPSGPAPIPQGTVAGTERGPVGRGPMVGNPGTAGPVGNTGPVGSHRRNPTGGGGASDPRSASTNRSQRGGFFTPGGAGLVQRPSATGPRTREEKRDDARPEYLTEDGETWKGRRGVVPPVIE